MRFNIIPPQRSPFRSVRAYNNLLQQILDCSADGFVGFCMYVGLFGLKPAELHDDGAIVNEVTVTSSQPGSLITGVMGSDIPSS